MEARKNAYDGFYNRFMKRMIGLVISGIQVSVMLHATSPIALVYKDKSLDVDAEGTSPKTGERNMAGVAGMLALVCAGFGVYAVKRSRKEA